MKNPFERVPSLADPARDIVAVVPSDSQDLNQMAVALFIETGGTIVVQTTLGATRTIKVPDFFLLPAGVRRVLETGTTASGIHALQVTA